MADYIDAIVEYEDRPSEEERKAAGYKNTWTWFCDYLNTTDLTQEQKFGIAISMSDYSDKTKQKIWNMLRSGGVSMVQKIKNVLYITMRGVDLTQCTNLSFKIVQGDSFSKIYTPTVASASRFTVEVPKADVDSLTVRPSRCQLTFTDEVGNSRATEIAVVDVEELL